MSLHEVREEILIADLGRLIAHREVDIVLATPVAPYVLHIHGEYDGYGDLFSILAADVEYVDFPGGMTVAEILPFSSAANALLRAPKWRGLRGGISAQALVFRSADAASWDLATDGQLALVVADRISIFAGQDWARANA
jgi:hypothetical protein